MARPPEPTPIPDAVLASHLVGLLEAHGMGATVRGTDVLVEGDEARWVRLRASPSSTESVLRIHVEAAAPDGTVLSDALNGLGDEVQARLGDVLTQFCIADFHVLLASVWGLLEEDQVDHHAVVTQNGTFDLYLGPWLSRMSDPAETIPAPERDFADALLVAATDILTERKPTAGRVFVASFKGEMTYEALIDGEPNAALETLLRALPLEHSVTGYASQRLFFVAIPQEGGPAHRRVSRCSEPKRAPARPWHRPAVAIALVVLVIAASAYLLR